MKRLVLAATVAVGIHTLLMSMDFDWLNLAGYKKPSTGSVTITLESVQPRMITPKINPLPPHRYPPEINKVVDEKIPKIETPPSPTANEKPVETTKKPEKNQSLPKPVPPKTKRQEKRQEPALQDHVPQASLESVPEEPLQASDAQPPPAEEPPTGFEGQSMAASTTQADLPPAVEDAIPEYRKNPPISYPTRARRKGYEGTVMLEVLVNRNGRVDDLRVLASSGYEILDRSAVKSVKTWSFKPAKKGNETVDMWVKVPVRFKLK
ncbi:MAG: TonB family protein [Desulfobacterales bacterium]